MPAPLPWPTLMRPLGGPHHSAPHQALPGAVTQLAPPAQSSLGASGGMPARSSRSDISGAHGVCRGCTQQGQHRAGAIPLGPGAGGGRGGLDCPLHVNKASQRKGPGGMEGSGSDTGVCKAKCHSPAPPPPGVPAPGNPHHPKGLCGLLITPCARLVSPSPCAFPEDRDLS